MTTTATLDPATASAAGTTSATNSATTSAVSSSGRRHAVVPTALAEVTLVAQGEALVGLYYPDHRPEPDRTGFGPAVDLGDDSTLASAAQQLVEYLGGRREAFDLPLQPAGSERARQVWDLIAAVPRGETTTYAALGRAVGVGPRAAGQFVARNPLPVVVPCHRVVAFDGRLTGYAGGVDRKRQLLALEGALPAADARPAGAATTPGGVEVGAVASSSEAGG